MAAFAGTPAGLPPEAPVIGVENYDAAQGVLSGLRSGSVSPTDAQKSLYWLANGHTQKDVDKTSALAAGQGIGLKEAPPIEVSSAPSGVMDIGGVTPSIPEQVVPFKTPPTKGSTSGGPAQTPDAAASELDKLSKGVASMSGAEDASTTPGWGFGTGALASSVGMAKTGGVAGQAGETPPGKPAENDVLSERRKIDAEIGRASHDAAYAGATGAAEKANEWGDLNRRLVEEDAGWQKTQARYKSEADRMMGEADELRKEIKQAEVDKRSYLERNPFSGIALAIGAAIGGALSARTGGPNQGLQTLERAIDRDIDLQKYAIDKKRGDLGAVDNLLARNMKIFGDAQQARAATRFQMKEATLTRIQQIGESTNSAVMKENANLVSATLAKQVNNEDMQLRAMNEQRAMALASSQHGAAQSPEGQMYQLDMEKWALPMELSDSGDGKTKIGVFLPKGADSEKVREKIVVAKKLDVDLARVEQLSEKLKGTWNPAQKAAIAAEIQGALADLTQERVASKGGGAAAQYEVTGIANSLGNPADWFDVTGGKTAALRAAIARDRRNMYSAVIGYPVGVYGYSPDHKIMARFGGSYAQRSSAVNFTAKK